MVVRGWPETGFLRESLIGSEDLGKNPVAEIRPLAKITRTGKMPIPQELFFLVGWAEESVQ